MTRSRLRRPTSKSMATVLNPCWARPVARLALVVVFPTPPLPEVMTTTLDTMGLLWSCAFHSTWFRRTHKFFAPLLQRRRFALAVLHPDLRRLAAQRGGDLVGAHVLVRYRHQLRLQ